MKKYIRIIALILAVLTLSGTLVACANTDDPEVTTDNPEAATTTAPEPESTAEETLFAPDDLEESYNFDTEITVYMWSDYTMMEFYAEESGDIIDDAIYGRNNDVENRLGITLEFVQEPGSGSSKMTPWMARAENDWKADNDYDIYAGYSICLPQMTLKGMTVNLLEHDAFSVEKPWWPEALTTECTINDKLCYCSGDISTNLLWMMTGTFYNKDLYEKYYGDEKSPMDMVENNEWTMEKLFTMTRDIYEDDGNSKKDEADTYGYVLYEVNINSFQTAAGITMLERDKDKGLRISEAWTSQSCADVCDFVGNLVKSAGVIHSSKTSVRDVFYEERALFITDRTYIVSGKDTVENSKKIEFDYGVVPQPKFNANQENFKNYVGLSYTMYGVNSNSKDIEAAVTTLEAMGSANHRTVIPAVFEVTMKVRYTNDSQSARMYDILRENISFDIGQLFTKMLGDISPLFRTTALSTNPSGILSNIEKNRKIIESGIKTIMKFYEG
ncbi:MAG: extracellular solute-binding protein [Clostridia bacterium]|nr:extracellular solute-binding protein [Clostridia bacterium]